MPVVYPLQDIAPLTMHVVLWMKAPGAVTVASHVMDDMQEKVTAEIKCGSACCK